MNPINTAVLHCGTQCKLSISDFSIFFSFELRYFKKKLSENKENVYEMFQICSFVILLY